MKNLMWWLKLVVTVCLASGALYWLVDGPPLAEAALTQVAEAPSAATETSLDAVPMSRGLGERCWKDCDCESRECKKFRCVARNYKKHPLLDAGQKCIFDGDCRSCSCSSGVCR